MSWEIKSDIRMLVIATLKNINLSTDEANVLVNKVTENLYNGLKRKPDYEPKKEVIKPSNPHSSVFQMINVYKDKVLKNNDPLYVHIEYDELVDQIVKYYNPKAMEFLETIVKDIHFWYE